MGEKVLMKGNEALAEGAIRAGCRFFSGYPITPQNEVPEYMSRKIADAGGVFIQAESEVSAINMIYGAAATGIRTMTSSSSPGISLKQEGISYMAGADLPTLIANVVRGGPGLGNIAGAQGDYFQAVKGGGHGDYRLIVLAPGSVNEMGNLPAKAYELAYKYRMPVMILADGVLGQMMEPVEFTAPPVDVSKLKTPAWALGVNNGREKRVVNSYDLDEGKLEIRTVARYKQYREIEKNEVMFEAKNTEDAELVIVAYGTSARASLATLREARKRGLKLGLLRPITLWPFPTEEIARLAGKAKSFLVVEMSTGQMVEDVRLAVNGRKPVHLYARPSGGMPDYEEILAQVESILNDKVAVGGAR
jgi:2-oxoglutarate ferredoxin oxidoreductase subunit alpha